jgi:lysozyme family protein
MTAANFPTCLADTLKEEGGFSDNPLDSGGPTNLGITLATLSHWLGGQATVEDVQNLTVADVTPIYHQLYWQAVHGDALPAGVDLMVWDTAVNSGPLEAIELLQRTVHVKDDGLIGPITMAAVNAIAPKLILQGYGVARAAFYRDSSRFAVFGKGWLARLSRVEAEAMALA